MRIEHLEPSEFMNIIVDGGLTSELYEEDRELLKHVEDDLEGYLQEIDNIFTNDEKSNVFFNLGFLYSINSSHDSATDEFYNVIDEFSKKGLLSGLDTHNFITGFKKHRSEFYTNLEKIDDKTELAAAYVERAIVTKYMTDSINSITSIKSMMQYFLREKN